MFLICSQECSLVSKDKCFSHYLFCAEVQTLGNSQVKNLQVAQQKTRSYLFIIFVYVSLE